MIAVRMRDFAPVAAPSFAGFCEDDTPIWALPSGPPGNVRSPASAPLAALAGGALAHRFHSWRGVSGRRRMVSVFPARACPDFAEAVFLAVTRTADGAAHILAVGGSLRGLGAAVAVASEIHVHLIAETPGERARVVSDLAGAVTQAQPRARRASRL